MPQNRPRDEGPLEFVGLDDVKSTMTVSSQILAPGKEPISAHKTLCDTGASSNFVSLEFYRRHEDFFLKSATSTKKQVRLGDGETLRDILFVVKAKIRFTDVLGYDIKGGTAPKSHDVDIQAYVFDISSYDVIIGLPTLLRSLYPYFITVLRRCKEVICRDTPDDSVSALDLGDLVHPFPEREVEAPEEIDTPIPGHGLEYLASLESTFEDRKQAYFDLFDTHIDKDFAAQTDVINLMKTLGTEVFVASNWEGIKGDPVEYTFRDDMPKTHLPKARPVPQRFADILSKELARLRDYLFVPSESPVVCPIVVADKATHPFIRVCGDFTWLNQWIVMPHVPIPPILPTLAKISNYKYFIDADLANAFHQLKLGRKTSEMCSIITPDGAFRPQFVLEGTSPASGLLHQRMKEIFKDFDDWTIVMFDNILLLCNSYEDAYEKLEKFLTRCKEHNIFLKLEKTWLGVQKVTFFGYCCEYQKYYLSQERTKALAEVPFPDGIKPMQSFLGTANFFKSFIPNYSDHTAKLHDMTTKTFPWGDESKWTHDYRECFEDFKKVLVEAFTLHYPDYDLPWILRVDASTMGIGSVLLQDRDGVLEPIMFQSQKFSKQAMNWSTIEQECYAIYHSVRQLAYYLRCKEFVIETDHRNLVWMHHSEVPKIIRWRIYLQMFNFLIRHIPGKQNIVADMLSRQWPTTPAKEFSEALNSVVHELEECTTFDCIMHKVHGGRAGHRGVTRTYRALCELFPGHNFSIKMVQDYILDCPVCQKDRILEPPTIPGVVKTLHVSHARSMVGLDTLSMPEAEDGCRYIVVMVNFFTRYVKLYPVKDKEAITTAGCVFRYICDYGLFDALRMDPASDNTSEVMAHLLRWLGPTRSLNLVDNPQADGVEGTNKQIHRHLIALCMDEHCKIKWSDNSVLPIVQLILNEEVHSETGVIPMHAQFGEHDAIYSQITNDESRTPAETTNEYIRLLSDNLRSLRAASAAHQAKVKAERQAMTSPLALNKYQRGDFVLYRISKMQRKDKLDPRNQGPYKVIAHIPDTNWVDVQNLVTGVVERFDLKDLQAFRGTAYQAQELAEYDLDQHRVLKVSGHRGNPELRTSMEFLVHFQGDPAGRWMTCTPDLMTNEAVQAYCENLPQLRQLLLSAALAAKLKRQCLLEDILLVKPKSVAYVDIREWGPGLWYSNLSLPDKDTLTYVLRCEYGAFCGSKKHPHRLINAYFPTLGITYKVNNWFVSTYGHKFKEPLPDHVVLTKPMIKRYKVDLTD